MWFRRYAVANKLLALQTTLLLVVLGVSGGAAHSKDAVGESPMFSATQAFNGKQAYAEHCASCHGESLRGGSGPALAGEAFLEHWANGRKTADDLNYIIM